jgi:hypothetical protein
MTDNTVSRTGRLSAAKSSVSATPRLFIVRRPPARQRDGQAFTYFTPAIALRRAVCDDCMRPAPGGLYTEGQLTGNTMAVSDL